MSQVYTLDKILCSADYVSGLRAIELSMSEIQRQLLQNQYYLPNRTATATQLGEILNMNCDAISSLYWRLGRLFSKENGVKPSQQKIDGPRWWSIWSSGYKERNSGRFFWEMRPEVAEALEELGWVTPNSVVLKIFPDEVKKTEIFREGAVRQILVNAYERNSQARQQCIAQHGESCFVCHFNFGKVFGELGKGFIYVHHLLPLSEIAEEYDVDPVKDLRPICPNCHAMIHRLNSHSKDRGVSLRSLVIPELLRFLDDL
jgi:5-methylcytosine-specific restriction enzyme A